MVPCALMDILVRTSGKGLGQVKSTQVVSRVNAFGSLCYEDNTRALVDIIVRSSGKGINTGSKS